MMSKEENRWWICWTLCADIYHIISLKLATFHFTVACLCNLLLSPWWTSWWHCTSAHCASTRINRFSRQLMHGFLSCCVSTMSVQSCNKQIRCYYILYDVASTRNGGQLKKKNFDSRTYVLQPSREKKATHMVYVLSTQPYHLCLLHTHKSAT